jgi:hypothetical protein
VIENLAPSGRGKYEVSFRKPRIEEEKTERLTMLFPLKSQRKLNWSDAARPNFSPRCLLLTEFLAEVHPMSLSLGHSTSSQLTSPLFSSLITTIDYCPQQPRMSSNTFGASTITFVSLLYLSLYNKRSSRLLLT